MVGAVFSPPPPQQQVIPDVVPMRRGRPTASSQGHGSKPSPSPLRGTASDPFKALDTKSPPGPVDEISNRFPSLDQFSLLHDGGKFDFEKSSPTKPSHPRDLSQRVTEKLADDAFALPALKTPMGTSSVKPPTSVVSRAQKIISSNPELQAVASLPSVVHQPTPTRPINSSYVSQGTMTTPTPPPTGQPVKYNPSSVQRFPAAHDHHRSSSLPRNQEAANTRTQFLHPEENVSLLSSAPRNSSFTPQPHHSRHASSSRPSLEGGRPSNEVLDPIARTKSSNSRPRPASTYLESNMDFLREKESSGRPSLSEKRASYSKDAAVKGESSDEETNIASNVDFLKTMEDSDQGKHHRRRSSSQKSKRSSLPSMTLSGTKNLLAGKFGDAFKRFELNTNTPPPPRTPSPLQEMERRDLTPIAGSEATDGRSDDGNLLEDIDNLPPEQRREIERRRLSMEEKRVANAAAEYRKHLAERGSSTAPKSIGGVSRATSIQNKVKNLLDESQGSSPVKKTAEGYGHFTDSGLPPQANNFDSTSANPYTTKPLIARKPIVQAGSVGVINPRTAPPMQNDITFNKPRSSQPPPSQSNSMPLPLPIPATVSKTGGARPNAPPKPMHLNSISTGPRSDLHSSSPPKSSGVGRPVARTDMSAKEKEDYIADFSKRFPSLSGIELVERKIEVSKDERGLRSKEV
jgi:AP2-associated kinase